MAKKNCPPKKKSTPKGLSAAAASGGEPLEVSVKRMSMQLPLRDLFAAVALNGILSGPIAQQLNDFKEIVGLSFDYADAMMKRRETK